MRATLLLAASAALLPAMARAQDVPACARFEEPLAYNACLASHGPKAKDLGSAPGAGARKSDSDAPAPAEAPRSAHGAAQAYRRHGRIHMEFRLR